MTSSLKLCSPIGSLLEVLLCAQNRTTIQRAASISSTKPASQTRTSNSCSEKRTRWKHKMNKKQTSDLKGPMTPNLLPLPPQNQTCMSTKLAKMGSTVHMALRIILRCCREGTTIQHGARGKSGLTSHVWEQYTESATAFVELLNLAMGERRRIGTKLMYTLLEPSLATLKINRKSQLVATIPSIRQVVLSARAARLEKVRIFQG